MATSGKSVTILSPQTDVESVNRSNMRTIAKRFAKEAQERLGDRVEKIVLFGSVATDSCGEDSDIDILIVCKGDRRFIRGTVSDIVVDYLLKYDKYLSVKIVSSETRNSSPDLPFYRRLKEESVNLV